MPLSLPGLTLRILQRSVARQTIQAGSNLLASFYMPFEGAAPDDERRAEHTAQILDLPSPWSERPDIPREKFHARCYQGASRRGRVVIFLLRRRPSFITSARWSNMRPTLRMMVWSSEWPSTRLGIPSHATDLANVHLNLFYITGVRCRCLASTQDVRRQIPLEIRERFKHRKDSAKEC